MTALTRSNTVEDWKQAILALLAGHEGSRCSLLTLMSAAKLQSRSTAHPFNDALTALIDEKRVLWSDVPGYAIQIGIIA